MYGAAEKASELVRERTETAIDAASTAFEAGVTAFSSAYRDSTD